MSDHDLAVCDPEGCEDYGHRTPTCEDIDAIAEYVGTVAHYLSDKERAKLLDRAGGVFEAYVESFRPAAED